MSAAEKINPFLSLAMRSSGSEVFRVEPPVEKRVVLPKSSDTKPFVSLGFIKSFVVLTVLSTLERMRVEALGLLESSSFGTGGLLTQQVCVKIDRQICCNVVAIAFVCGSYVLGTRRQTNSQTHSTGAFHLQENNSESRAMGKSLTTTPNQYLQPIGRTQRKNHCPSALLINYFPPQTVLWILTTDDSRRFGLKFTPKTLLLDVISFPSMTLLFPFRHFHPYSTSEGGGNAACQPLRSRKKKKTKKNI
ncbi:hypothetical protein CCH79_00012322 [Gambusia affinis]|uniref:Uncharacterized protein n=1 Tax=Gambusia affinis TaxID=33528 RepID=A0A315UQP9_GAMAF|nr:hypothetical protein CCH79_00012322 [Gambusia affinis]